MQEFNYTIKYIKGKSNVVADALSRKNNVIELKSTDLIRKLLFCTTVKMKWWNAKWTWKGYKTDERI